MTLDKEVMDLLFISTEKAVHLSDLLEKLSPPDAASELLHGAESPDSADGFSASALSTVSTQQSTD